MKYFDLDEKFKFLREESTSIQYRTSRRVTKPAKKGFDEELV
jgi:hypothetical protein